MRLLYILIIILIIKISPVEQSLHSILKHYEVLKFGPLFPRIKRGTEGKVQTALSFTTFGKQHDFRLELDESVKTNDFHVEIVGSNKKYEPFDRYRGALYTGYEVQDRKTTLTASHDGAYMWHIHIVPDNGEEIFIEPAKHLQADYHRNDDHIAYKYSSIISNNTQNKPFCYSSASLFSSLHKKATTHYAIQRNPPSYPTNTSVKRSNPIHNHFQYRNELNRRLRQINDTLSFFNNQKAKITPNNSNEDGRYKNDKLKRAANTNKNKKQTGSSQRSSRDANWRDEDEALDAQDTCDMAVVVDYEAYRGIGRRSPSSILAWITKVFQGINEIYAKSGLTWDGLTYKIALRKVVIHTAYTPVTHGLKHFNMADNPMGDEGTILNFMKNSGVGHDFCLLHLITQRNFGHALGIAAIAAVDNPRGEGICAIKYEKDRQMNAGMSTTMNKGGDTLPHAEYVRVIAHEIGHNFGAQHDPDTEGVECSPFSSKGGKYLMWPYTSQAVKGKNGRVFSPCSLRNIAAIMRARANACFISKRYLLRGHCGNGILDIGEDCEPTLTVDMHIANKKRGSPCCTERCRFATGAECSHDSHPCCTQACKIAARGTPCVRRASDLDQCQASSQCDGVSAFGCPPGEPLADNTPCGARGSCVHGRCRSFCENHGLNKDPPRQLRACNCDTGLKEMCQLCCYDETTPEIEDIKCINYGGYMGDGAPCLMGFCKNGECSEDNTSQNDLLEKIQEQQINGVYPATIKITHVAISFIAAQCFVFL